MPFSKINTDTLIIKYQQFKSAQKAAHELMQLGYGVQAADSYIALCALILDVETELKARRISLHNLQSTTSTNE